MNDIPIEHYTVERVPNPNPLGEVSWQLYHAVRNAIVRCCRQFGPTGPMGECPITADTEPPDNWPSGDPAPIDFFVVDDQYNHERYIYVELVRPGGFTQPWLTALVRTIEQFPGWGVGVMAFRGGYILAFGDRLLVTGEIFAGCTDFDSVVKQGQAELSKPSPAKPDKS